MLDQVAQKPRGKTERERDAECDTKPRCISLGVLFRWKVEEFLGICVAEFHCVAELPSSYINFPNRWYGV